MLSSTQLMRRVSNFVVCTLYYEFHTNFKLLIPVEGCTSDKAMQRDTVYPMHIGDVLRISYGPIPVLSPGGRTPV